jgi:hypothetical protein
MSGTNSNWKCIYKIGGIVAMVFIVYSLVTMIILIVIGGPPESALEAFNLLEENKLLGYLRLDVLTILIVPLYYPLFLSIFVALRRYHISYLTLGALLAFAGVTLFLATPSVFSLASLSDKYAVATTVAQKDQLIAAGEALLASDMWHNTGAMIGGILMLIATLILSIVMLFSGIFGKTTAVVGILTHGLDLIHIIVGTFSPQAGVIIMVIAGPLYLVWFPLLGRDLFRLGRLDSNES